MTARPATPSVRVRPISFSGPMIRALLDGRKTQTRRILKNQATWDRIGKAVLRRWPNQKADVPYQGGDLLWVREQWQDYCPMWSGYWCGHGTQAGIERDHEPVYHADPPERHLRGPEGKQGRPLKWRPSIHMPRWASRITLEVEAVKVERLQEISEADAEAEGVWRETVGTSEGPKALWFGVPHVGCDTGPRDAFVYLWDDIHNPRGLCAGDAPASSWEANPWVVALTFRVHRCNVDRLAR